MNAYGAGLKAAIKLNEVIESEEWKISCAHEGAGYDIEMEHYAVWYQYVCDMHIHSLK